MTDSASPTEQLGDATRGISPSSEPSDGGRFVPGTILAGRYRVIGLLGRGGMGQVYRADDLKLGQPVALKFLPEGLAHDGAALARFHREVRVARQISHPNVCRVFDIGEVQGQAFITMEYIDGEDLSSLIRRIGRLPQDKAIEIARQLCAGLAAAHDAGVLHRDLKPANVMLDGRGRARITDFGLAGLEAEFRGAEVRSGTPAYMAPEQLAGKEVTQRSEVYALGLVLYELFTGHRVFDGAARSRAGDRAERPAHSSPSTHVKDLDPVVERVIMRCLEDDPARRPQSVVHVAAALPGGNPLEAALAAGETPSPEMVAATTTEGALSSRVATACLVAIGALLVLLSIGDKVNLHHLARLEKSPAVLADRAATLLDGLGYTAPPANRASGWDLDQAYFGYADPLPPAQRWARLGSGQPLTYFFWYRQGPRPITPIMGGRLEGTVSWFDPPATDPGMASVVLDPRGRLVRLAGVPPASEDSVVSGRADWRPLFAAAGLDSTRLTPAASLWTPQVYADERAAWTGVFPDRPDIPMRVEAAAHRGRPVLFQVIAPWDKPTLGSVQPPTGGAWAALMLMAFLAATILAGGLVLVRGNLRSGRGDTRGALKLALFGFVVTLASVLIGADFPADIGGLISRFIVSARTALFAAAVLWLLYLALEPYIRRNRPHLIGSWSRLLAGEFRDPKLGGDALVGVVLGLLASGAWCLSGWLKLWVNHPIGPNRALDAAALGGFRHLAALVAGSVGGAVWIAFATLVLVALARRPLKKEWLAAVVIWLIFSAISILAYARSWPAIGSAAIGWGLMIIAVARFGLVAGVVFNLVRDLTWRYPLTTDFSAWYAAAPIVVLLIIGGLSMYAYAIARGGQGRPGVEAAFD